jgi:hypothetical protein
VIKLARDRGTIPAYPERALSAVTYKNGPGRSAAALLGAGALAAGAALAYRSKYEHP